MTPRQWGSVAYVAFYWLSEAGTDIANPVGVLLPDTQYDAFHVCASAPAAPFATFSESNGGTITIGTTTESIVPEPSTGVLLALGLGVLAGRSRRARS